MFPGREKRGNSALAGFVSEVLSRHLHFSEVVPFQDSANHFKRAAVGKSISVTCGMDNAQRFLEDKPSKISLRSSTTDTGASLWHPAIWRSLFALGTWP